MRFLLDENISYRVAPILKTAGHDAVHVSEMGLGSADDKAVMACALDEGRILVTCDHDFVQMLFSSGASRPSVILAREVDTMRAPELGALLLDALSPELKQFLLDGAIASLTLEKVRVRPLPLRS